MSSCARLRRRALPKIWGSTQTEPFYPNSSEKIGEVWFEHDRPLPLLVKFLFTTDALSVQVHPPDDYAWEHHRSKGKTEMWHVVCAEPEATVACGFREPISAERLRESSLSGEIIHLLQYYEARPGDTFFLPARTVHAIGSGLVLCEIQQQSDITYRLYDYDRPNRPLHLDDGCTVSHLTSYNPRREEKDGVLATCAYFTTRRVVVSGSLLLDSPKERILAILRGSGTVEGEPAKPGEGFLVTGPIHLEGSMELLSAEVP